MMIGFTTDDGKSAIELLDEEEANHLVRKGHLRERDLALSSGIDAGREAIRTADKQDEALRHGLQTLLHPLAELTAGHLASPLIEQDQHIARLQTFEDEVGLTLFLLLFAERLGIAEVGYLFEGGRQIMCEPLNVFFDQRREDRACGSAGKEDVKFHKIS